MIDERDIIISICDTEQQIKLQKDYSNEDSIFLSIIETDDNSKRNLAYLNRKEALELIDSLNFMFKMGKYE